MHHKQAQMFINEFNQPTGEQPQPLHAGHKSQMIHHNFGPRTNQDKGFKRYDSSHDDQKENSNLAANLPKSTSNF